MTRVGLAAVATVGDARGLRTGLKVEHNHWTANAIVIRCPADRGKVNGGIRIGKIDPMGKKVRRN